MATLHLANEIFKLIYPVGSIYMSWNSTNPSTLFGGTWTRLQGGFIYGCVSNSGIGNGTGTSTNEHTLTIDQIPAHNHTWSSPFYKFAELNMGYHGDVFKGDKWQDSTAATNKTGGGKGHSHKIPFMAVFIWRRTA